MPGRETCFFSNLLLDEDTFAIFSVFSYTTNIKHLLLYSKWYYIFFMEDIKGSIQLSDRRIVIIPTDGKKETWVRQLNPEFETGIQFIRYKGDYFFQK